MQLAGPAPKSTFKSNNHKKYPTNPISPLCLVLITFMSLTSELLHKMQIYTHIFFFQCMQTLSHSSHTRKIPIRNDYCIVKMLMLNTYLKNNLFFPSSMLFVMTNDIFFNTNVHQITFLSPW